MIPYCCCCCVICMMQCRPSDETMIMENFKKRDITIFDPIQPTSFKVMYYYCFFTVNFNLKQRTVPNCHTCYFLFNKTMQHYFIYFSDYDSKILNNTSFTNTYILIDTNDVDIYLFINSRIVLLKSKKKKNFMCRKRCISFESKRV